MHSLVMDKLKRMRHLNYSTREAPLIKMTIESIDWQIPSLFFLKSALRGRGASACSLLAHRF